MPWSKINTSTLSLLYSLVILTIVIAAISFAAKVNTASAHEAETSELRPSSVLTATFNANPVSLGLIPDHAVGCDATGGTPRNVTFAVTGMSGSVTSVVTNMTFGSPIHTWASDVEAVLIAPNGANQTLFGRTGEATSATGCGDSSDLSGPYTFSDAAAAPPSGGWWQAASVAGAAVPIPSGTYRSTAIGGLGATNPQPPTSINPSFTGVTNANGTWTLRLSDHGGGDTGGISAASLTITTNAPVARSPVDFDGDNKTDISIFRPGPGEWWYLRSSDGVNQAAQFGAGTDKLAPGDFTGDHKTDIVIWRPSTGQWFVLRSEDSTFFAFPFGSSGDVPAPADFDGDGKTDAAVFRPSDNTWYISKSTGGTTIMQFGQAGDVPVAADYDGDASADIAIYRPSLGQWWMQRSTAGLISVTFGSSTDKTVQGDYTGDGKADVAIWRPSTGEWFVLRSEDFSFFSFPFGLSTDVPSPGDYDGDGKFDAAVFRPSSNTWFIQRTTAGQLIQPFGIAGDRSVPNAFVR